MSKHAKLNAKLQADPTLATRLVEALRFLIDYEEDAFAGTPQGEPRWLRKYKKLLRELDAAE